MVFTYNGHKTKDYESYMQVDAQYLLLLVQQ